MQKVCQVKIGLYAALVILVILGLSKLQNQFDLICLFLTQFK